MFGSVVGSGFMACICPARGGSAVSMNLDKELKKWGVSKKARKSLISEMKKDPEYKKAKAKLKKLQSEIEKVEAEYKAYADKAKQAEKASRASKKKGSKKKSKK